MKLAFVVSGLSNALVTNPSVAAVVTTKTTRQTTTGASVALRVLTI